MNREIKFRAWETNKGLGSKMSMPFTLTDLHNKGLGVFGDTYIFMQLTGLYDKHNNPIFEGDIVYIKHPYKNRKYVGEIIYKNNMFTGKDFYFAHHDIPNDIFESIEYLEIIGNIYENTEVL